MSKVTPARRSQVIVVGTERYGLSGSGKVQPEKFFPVLRKSVLAAGGEFFVYPTVAQFKPRRGKHVHSVVIAVYREGAMDDATFDEVRSLESLVSELPGSLLVHPARLGALVGDKAAAHGALSALIPMPEIASDGLVFSNSAFGSAEPVEITSAEHAGNSGRYNRRFIDTGHEFRGASYYVCLRAMAVGEHMTDLFVRCRPTAEGNPAVHAKDIPLDPDLIAHLHETVAVPRTGEIAEICARAGKVLGPGFYAYDILPQLSSGRSLVCEVNIKFHDWHVPGRLLPLADKVPIYRHLFTGQDMVRTVRAFVEMCRDHGYLTGG